MHNTDGRYTTPETIDNQIYISYVDLPDKPGEPKLMPYDPNRDHKRTEEAARREYKAVERIRAHRVEAGGKKYQLLRGEFHRHTEMRIDILKDSQVVETIKTDKEDYHSSWTDPQPTPGVHYYYVRVQQADGELAWASPMWIHYDM